MKLWRSLLLLYRELDVTVKVERRRRHFRHLARAEEIADAREAFRALPDLVAQLTDGIVRIEPHLIDGPPVRSLTARAPNEYWPSPDDTRGELDRFAPSGKFDSIFVFWPQHDFAHGVSIPGSAWGLGMGASEWSNGATYAAVANAPHHAWAGEAPGEVWLHEWLHGVCHHFAAQGLAMPARDADGAELHGYVRSPTRGWCDYYRDLMNGQVPEGGKFCGIPATAWAA